MTHLTLAKTLSPTTRRSAEPNRLQETCKPVVALVRSPFTGKSFQTVSLSQQVRGYRLKAFGEMSIVAVFS
jgi:hypothetical protein